MAQCRKRKLQHSEGDSLLWGLNFIYLFIFAVGRVWSQLVGGALREHTEDFSVMSVHVLVQTASTTAVFSKEWCLPGLRALLSVGFAADLPCRNPVTAPALRFFGFLYRPCGAATRPRNPAPPQPPGRSMWQLPCKIPKSLQRHLVPAWENRWQHWHGSLSACFSF